MQPCMFWVATCQLASLRCSDNTAVRVAVRALFTNSVLGVAVAQLPHAEIKLQPSQLDMAANSLLGLPKASDNPGFD